MPPARLAAILLVALVIVAAPTARAWAEPGSEPLPRFNEEVLRIIATYPDQGFGGYAWPAPRGTHGTTRDLALGGVRIARAGSGNHCVGITFEVFWRVLARWPGGLRAAGLDAAAARDLLRIWFVPRDGGAGAAAALVKHGLGRRIDDLDDALPGDFVQVWMHGGLGHAAVFLGWTRDPQRRIIGIRYWSSQPWTDGLGASESVVGDEAGDVDRAKIFIGRAEPPARAR